MSVRWISAVPLSVVLLAWPLLLPAQAGAQPGARSEVQSVPQGSQASAAPTSDSAPPITVQIAPPPISISSGMLGVSSPLGAQPASGKPIYAEFAIEHHQSFADGTHISRSTFSCIYRDTQGRIRRESQLSVPGLAEGIAAATFITIIDHQLGFGYILNPQEMVAHRYELNGAGPSYIARLNAQATGTALLSPDPKPAALAAANPVPAADSAAPWRMHAFSPSHIHPAMNGGPGVEEPAPTMRIDQPFLAAPNPVRTENLGEQIILGFRTRGTRVITTLPVGQIGNDRPIDIVSEQWFSPDLEIVMRSAHHDPWAGEFTTTVTKVSRGDQPATLFGIPSAYKLVDAATEGEHHILDGHGTHSPGPAPW